MNADFSVIDFLDFRAGTVRINKDVSSLPALKQHYVQQAGRFADQLDTGIDAVYFSGEYPSVYFKRVLAFTPDVVRSVIRLQRKVWNQGKVPFLYVESDTEVRVYNCYQTPQPDREPDAESKLRLFDVQTEGDKAKKDLETLQQVFGKVAVESGRFWQESKYAQQVDVRKRVDRALVDNIKKARELLRKKGLSEHDDVIHDLLLRSLFILYLQDRGATDQAFYETYLPGATSYFDILENKAATYRLFEKLESAFNGNLCPVIPVEMEVVTNEHLQIIKRCFWSDLALANQPVLFDWRVFDFGYVPIQVISEIYEDFLRKEVGEQQMAKTGAFYTPHALAEFILNQVLPYPSLGDTKHNIRTLDPACGSGIFLVDTLNRLLDRWEYANQTTGAKLTFEIIKQIVVDNIFGIEIEEEAIKVAAFSIYLTMLDRLDPKTLWQNNHFPYLIYNENKPSRQQGYNLFCMSSLADGPFVGKAYDLVVGNPPFTNKVSSEVMTYLNKHKFGKETVIAFIHRATELCQTGKIALISTSKILFNNGTGYQNFRRFLFNDTYVEKVYNFSALRRVSQQLGGRNLFASATRPVSVLIYSKQDPSNSSERIIYYSPTTAIKNRLIDGIAIDSTDVKYLPRIECQKPETKLWKIAMWGTERDFGFIDSLKGKRTLLESIQDKGWIGNSGVGFQTGNPKDKHNSSLKKIPYIDTEKITRYYTHVDRTEPLKIEDFSRLGKLSAYKAPHLLIRAGQQKNRFCSSFIDFDCSFRKKVYGIYTNDENSLKLLCAYLNSSLASYLMFLTTTSWGIEREEVNPNELLDLPDLCFTLPNEEQQCIIKLVDKIISLEKENTALSIEAQVANLENQIEIVFRDGLHLTDTDRILIDDLLTYRLGAFQNREESVAFHPVQVEYSRAYATQLCQAINSFLQPGDTLQARAEYYDVNRTTPLQVIILHLDEQKRQKTVEQLPAIGIDAVLRDIENYTYQEEAESIYFRRFIRYYNDDTIYIVKPNEQRFWSRSMALNDADEIILEILTSEI